MRSRQRTWLVARGIRAGALGILLAACRISPAVTRAPQPAAPRPTAASPVSADARQLVVVTTPAWDSTTGELRRYERSAGGDAWRAVAAVTPVVVGRTGLAWGIGFDGAGNRVSAADPVKREGDGRSPAGAFPLDTAFGFARPDSAAWIRLPYVTLTPESDCVDDSSSAHYNTVVSRGTVPRVDWTSAERMRSVPQYRLGVIVGYNAAPPVKGRGSCIFLHIWAGPRSTTAGCTALDAGELERLTAWLDPRRRPVIVQLPRSEYARLTTAWSLPRLQ